MAEAAPPNSSNSEQVWNVVAVSALPTGPEETRKKTFFFDGPNGTVVNCRAALTYRPGGVARTYGFRIAWEMHLLGQGDGSGELGLSGLDLVGLAAHCRYEIRNAAGEFLCSGPTELDDDKKKSEKNRSPLWMGEAEWTDEIKIILRVNFGFN